MPFRVNRTKSNNLPVYLNYRSGNTRTITVIRKLDGDLMVSGHGMHSPFINADRFPNMVVEDEGVYWQLCTVFPLFVMAEVAMFTEYKITAGHWPFSKQFSIRQWLEHC